MLSDSIKEFSLLPMNDNISETIQEKNWASTLQVFSGQKKTIDDIGNWFGFVIEGTLNITSLNGDYSLNRGMYFSLQSSASLSGNAQAVLINRNNWKGLFTIGGPVENKGRLKYIDGCSDTLLLAPVEKGDACLNCLYFPKNINQTPHTHPSVRIGVVYEGSGICHTANKDIELKQGSLFIIPAESIHCFSTQNKSMKVIAYHPDSDFGPTHEDHPMINKTIVDGTSARFINDIKTI